MAERGVMGGQQVRASDLIAALSPEARKRLVTDLGALDRLVREELVRQTVLAEARQRGWDKKADVQLLIERARAGSTRGVRQQPRSPADVSLRGRNRGLLN